jgi:DNA polymerase-3 subunit gamma/tau
MAAQALYRKWRSQNFDEVIGQEHVTLTLRNALREGRMSHAYLFTGPRGTGKTSTARILAKAINCLADAVNDRPDNQCRICAAITAGNLLDLIEIDAASNRGIDEIRELRGRISFRPNEARYKVYIIDEVHMLTKEAFNALLKTLEEPPEHAVFILATTEPERVPETVRSRCQRFDFRRIPTDEIVGHLQGVLAEEGRQAAPEALVAITRRSTGSMRDAISLVDQLLSYGDDVLDLARVERVLGLVDATAIARLGDSLANGDAAGGLQLIGRMVADGVELGQLVDQIVAYLRGVLFIRITQASDAVDVAADIRTAMTRQAGQLDTATLLGALRAFMEARGDLRDQVPGVPQLPIELAFLRALSEDRASEPVREPTVPRTQPSASPMAAAPPSVAAAPPASETKTPVQRPAPLAQSAPVADQPDRATPEPSSGLAPSAANLQLLERARDQWDNYLIQAGKRCGMKVQAALRSVRTLDSNGFTLVLQFSHAFSRDMVNQPEYRQQLEALWQELLGQPVLMRCILKGETTDPAAAPTPGAAPAGDDDEVLLRAARKMGAVVRPLQTEK